MALSQMESSKKFEKGFHARFKPKVSKILAFKKVDL